MYTTNEDVRNGGWANSGRNDGTLSHPNRSERITVVTGDTGQVYVQEVGTSNLVKFDPSIHSTPNN